MRRGDDDAMRRYVGLSLRFVSVLAYGWNEEQSDEEQSRNDIDGVVKAFSHLSLTPEGRAKQAGRRSRRGAARSPIQA